MSAQIVDLAKWRDQHPPLIRLASASSRCFFAWLNYNQESAAAWTSMMTRIMIPRR